MDNEQRQSEHLQKNVHEANLIREMCQTPGFKLLQKKFEEKMSRASSRLMDMSLSIDEIQKIRQQMFIWTEITNMLKAFMVTGQYSSKILNDEI